jgi:hypothetical protein
MKRIDLAILLLLSTAAFADYPVRLDRLAPSDSHPSDVVAFDDGRAHVVLDRSSIAFRTVGTAYSFAVDFNNPSPVNIGRAFLNSSPYQPEITASTVANGSLWLYAMDHSIEFSPPSPITPSGVLGLNQNASVQLNRHISILRPGKLIQIGGDVFEAQPTRLKPLNGAAIDLALCDNQNCLVLDFMGTSQSGYALRRQRLVAGDMRLDLVRFNANAQVTQVLPLITAGSIISGKLHGETPQLQLTLSTSTNQLSQNYLVTVDEGAQAQISAAGVINQLPAKRYFAVRNRDWLQVDTNTSETNYTLLRANSTPDLNSLTAPQVKFSVGLANSYAFTAVKGSTLGDIVLKRSQTSGNNERIYEHHWLRDDGTQIATSANWQAVDFTGAGNLVVAERIALAGQKRTQVLALDRNAQTIQSPQLLGNVNMTADSVQMIKNADDELVSFQTYPTSTSAGRAISVLKHSVAGNSMAIAELSPTMNLAHSLRLGLTHAFATRFTGAATEIQRVNLQTGQLDAPQALGHIWAVTPVGEDALVVTQIATERALFRFNGNSFHAIAVPSPFVPSRDVAATPEHPTDVARFIATSGNLTSGISKRVFALNAAGEVRVAFDLPPGGDSHLILNNGAVVQFNSGVIGSFLINPDGVPIKMPQHAGFSFSDHRGGYWTNAWIENDTRIVHTRSLDARTTISAQANNGASISDSDILSDGDLVIINIFEDLVHRYRIYENGTILQRSAPLVAVETLGENTIARLLYETIPSTDGQLRAMTSIQAYALPVMPERTDYLFADGLE